jgi:hypothetical protein
MNKIIKMSAAAAVVSVTQDESSQPFRFSLFEFLKLLVLIPFWVTVCTGNVTKTCLAYVDTVRDTKGKILFDRHSKPEKTKVQDGEIGLICFCTMTSGYETKFMRSYVFESMPVIMEGKIMCFGKFTTQKTGLSFPVSVTTKQPPGIEIGIPKLFVPALMLCLRDGKKVNVRIHASSSDGMELDYPKATPISVTFNRKGVPETITIIPAGKPPSDYVVVNLTRCGSVSDGPINFGAVGIW